MIEDIKEKLGKNLLLSAFRSSLENDVVLTYVCSELKEDYLETDVERTFLHYLGQYKNGTEARSSISMFRNFIETKISCSERSTEHLNRYLEELEAYRCPYKVEADLFSALDAHIKMRDIHKNCVLFKETATQRGVISAAEGLHKSLTNILYKKQGCYTNSNLMEGIDTTLEKAADRYKNEQKIPTGIAAYDNYTYKTGGTRGGLKRGTSFLCIGRSGTGKSLLLRSLCYHAVLHGHDVIHIQAEGTDLDMKMAYISMMSGLPLVKLTVGDFNVSDIKGKIDKKLSAVKKVAGTKEIGKLYTMSFENFMRPSLYECVRFIEGIYNKREKDKTSSLALIAIDYLDMFVDRYDENALQRKMKIGEEFTRIAIDYNVVLATATQAASVSNEFINGSSKYNSPPGLLDSHNISLDKQVINPFSYVVSINQSDEENRNEQIRFYEVKERHGERSTFPVHHVAMLRSQGHFISNKFTNP